MPVCHRCRAVQVSDESDLCLVVDELVSEALQQQANEQATIRVYSGDQYLTDSWLADGLSFEEARKIVEDSSYIGNIIELGELAAVLADKYATAALRKLLINRNPQILQALGRYARRRKVRRKPGPKPKGPEPLHIVVYKLRESGLTFGKIALRLWEHSSKSALARAHYHRALQRGFPRIQVTTPPKRKA